MTVQDLPKKEPDWLVIEADYRAGVKTLRQIAEEQGITHGAINKRAKRDDWTRSLSGKIKAKADALVSKEAVSTEVSAAKAVTEKAVVEANAELQYRIRIEHRQDIKRAKSLFQGLLSEVESAGVCGDLAEQLLGVLSPSEENEGDAGRKRADKQRELLGKVLALPNRVDSGKKLVDMLEKLVGLEREAFGIDDKRQLTPSTGDINISF